MHTNTHLMGATSHTRTYTHNVCTHTHTHAVNTSPQTQSCVHQGGHSHSCRQGVLLLSRTNQDGETGIQVSLSSPLTLLQTSLLPLSLHLSLSSPFPLSLSPGLWLNNGHSTLLSLISNYVTLLSSSLCSTFPVFHLSLFPSA